ncbi:hypothetical protein C5167_021060 [Papaver somniferum]|uniref:Uncharacterized protein n=1 Tax=Papaver somniferum TaxID=3469 RepID=A0A4Y7IYZ2_PAPSO|nr:hypothetical protein C5167_021060 [Papaver somniferum]
MEAKHPDARSLINVCDCVGFVPDVTHYLYTNNMLLYFEGYIHKVNPGNTPLVMGQLLDDEPNSWSILRVKEAKMHMSAIIWVN